MAPQMQNDDLCGGDNIIDSLEKAAIVLGQPIGSSQYLAPIKK